MLSSQHRAVPNSMYNEIIINVIIFIISSILIIYIIIIVNINVDSHNRR
jgi:hypothetical protein